MDSRFADGPTTDRNFETLMEYAPMEAIFSHHPNHHYLEKQRQPSGTFSGQRRLPRPLPILEAGVPQWEHVPVGVPHLQGAVWGGGTILVL